MATPLSQFEILFNGLWDFENDGPASGWVVLFKAAGLSTDKTAWEDVGATVPITRVTLDSNGRAEVYGDGLYKLLVYNKVPESPSAVLKYTFDNYNVLNTAEDLTSSVDFVADLRGLAVVSGQVVSVTNYDTLGDIGGGPDRYGVTGQPAGTYVDNGVTVILPTGGDGSSAWLMNWSGPINAAWAGAKTTAANNQVAILSALNARSRVVLNEQYEINAALVMPENTQLLSEGRAGGVYGSRNTLINANNGCTVKGLKIEIVGTQSPFWGVFGDNISDVVIEDNELVNARVFIRNTAAALQENLKVKDNDQTCDFTLANYTVEQLDPISVFGVQNVEITGNRINATNTHRIIKISDQTTATTPSAYRSRKVLIDGNIINGTTTSDKQAVDLFLGTTETIFSNNIVFVSGFNTVVENKTIEPYPDENTFTNLIIHDNILFFDKLGINVQGSWGSISAGPAVGQSNASIHDNILNRIGFTSTIRYGIEARFYHAASINDNQIFSDYVDTASALAHRGISLLSNKAASARGNMLDKCIIFVSRVTTDSGGDTFTGDTGDVIIAQNHVLNHRDDYTYRFESLAANTSGIKSNIHLIGNISTAAADNPGLGRSYRFSASTIDSLMMKDNTHTPYNGGAKGGTIATTTFVDRSEIIGNNWQAADVAGTVSTTTTAAGDVVVTHGAGGTPTQVSVEVTTSSPIFHSVTAITATTFTVRFWDSTGTAINAGAIAFKWRTSP